MFTYTQEDVDRFYAKVEYDDEGCWEWQSTIRGGYGLFSLNGKPVSAHRFALYLEIGEYEGSALHKCDNPPCVRGDHLFAGSQQDSKERRERKKPYKKQNPEDRQVRKLSLEDIETIQKELETPYWGQVKALAKRFGVNHSLISNIKAGRDARVSSK
jgi:hypothetical protein